MTSVTVWVRTPDISEDDAVPITLPGTSNLLAMKEAIIDELSLTCTPTEVQMSHTLYSLTDNNARLSVVFKNYLEEDVLLVRVPAGAKKPVQRTDSSSIKPDFGRGIAIPFLVQHGDDEEPPPPPPPPSSWMVRQNTFRQGWQENQGKGPAPKQTLSDTLASKRVQDSRGTKDRSKIQDRIGASKTLQLPSETYKQLQGTVQVAKAKGSLFASQWKSRFWSLSSDQLHIYKAKSELFVKKPSETIALKDITSINLASDTPKNTKFNLLLPGRNLEVMCTTPDEAKEWVFQINRNRDQLKQVQRGASTDPNLRRYSHVIDLTTKTVVKTDALEPRRASMQPLSVPPSIRSVSSPSSTRRSEPLTAPVTSTKDVPPPPPLTISTNSVPSLKRQKTRAQLAKALASIGQDIHSLEASMEKPPDIFVGQISPRSQWATSAPILPLRSSFSTSTDSSPTSVQPTLPRALSQKKPPASLPPLPPLPAASPNRPPLPPLPPGGLTPGGRTGLPIVTRQSSSAGSSSVSSSFTFGSSGSSSSSTSSSSTSSSASTLTTSASASVLISIPILVQKHYRDLPIKALCLVFVFAGLEEFKVTRTVCRRWKDYTKQIEDLLENSDEENEEGEEEEEEKDARPPSVVIDTGSWRHKGGLAGSEWPSKFLTPKFAAHEKKILGRVQSLVPTSTKPGAPKDVKCFMCQAMNAPKQKFCGQCGASLSQVTKTEPAAPPPGALPPGQTYDITEWEVRPEDYTEYERCWRELFETLKVDPKGHCVLVTQPIFAPKEFEEKLMDILFEKFDVKGAFVERQPVLTAYCYGFFTALVVDIGHCSTQICPFIDGHIIEEASWRVAHLSGRNLQTQMEKILAPHASTLDLKTNSSDFSDLATHVRETMLVVAEDYDEAVEKPSKFAKNLPIPAGKFPPGRKTPTSLSLSKERFNAAELFFQPRTIMQDVEATLYSIPELIQKALMGVAIDNREQLASHILLSGGLTKLPGFDKRLDRELKELLPHMSSKVNIFTNMTEREKLVWAGGSLLVGIDNHKWVDRFAWEEMKAASSSDIGKK